MANLVLCIFLLAFINLSLISSEKILTATDSNGKKHEAIGTVSPGQSITIYCPHSDSMMWSRASFTPGSTIEKLVTNNNIEIKDNQLKINVINFKDSGVYYCEKNTAAYRFFLHVLAITKTSNGTVPTSTIISESNGITFNQTKINEKKSANVSCFCDNGTNNTQLNIIWKGGLYDKWSNLYSIDTTRTDNGVSSTLILKKATNDPKLYGEYTCSCNAVSNTNKTSKVYMEVPPIFDEHESSIRTSEGEDIVLTCNVWGYPAVDNSTIKWSFQNNLPIRDGITITYNASRPGFSQLSFTKVTNADRGLYSCHASNSVGTNSATTMIRVKSRYAALWPFIGIIIQLIILIAIISVYEWKKSQKSKEQDNSKCIYDTRNEPDALGTERGNEPESVRQRLVKT